WILKVHNQEESKVEELNTEKKEEPKAAELSSHKTIHKPHHPGQKNHAPRDLSSTHNKYVLVLNIHDGNNHPVSTVVKAINGEQGKVIASIKPKEEFVLNLYKKRVSWYNWWPKFLDFTKRSLISLLEIYWRFLL